VSQIRAFSFLPFSFLVFIRPPQLSHGSVMHRHTHLWYSRAPPSELRTIVPQERAKAFHADSAHRQTPWTP
jgi:hypothetical protein